MEIDSDKSIICCFVFDLKMEWVKLFGQLFFSVSGKVVYIILMDWKLEKFVGDDVDVICCDFGIGEEVILSYCVLFFGQILVVFFGMFDLIDCCVIFGLVVELFGECYFVCVNMIIFKDFCCLDIVDCDFKKFLSL